MLLWILLEILLTSAVIRKQKFLHENEIVKYLHNCKYQDVNQGHLKKPLQASTNYKKNDYPATTHTFFTIRSILSYFLRLNFYNFRIALAKATKLNFLKMALKVLKTDQNSHSYSN